MLAQGMNYLLDIKQDLLLTPNGGNIVSNQQSAISNQQSAISNRFPLIFILLHYILSCFLPLFRVLLHLFALLKSYGARLCLHSLVIPIDCR
jgi:quinol-cytochrome oxidoreductase complex cytochrome b subunit